MSVGSLQLLYFPLTWLVEKLAVCSISVGIFHTSRNVMMYAIYQTHLHSVIRPQIHIIHLITGYLSQHDIYAIMRVKLQ